MTRRILSALCAATLLASVGATAVFAGEITGNGKSLQIAPHQLHGRSACAFSGQEDLQFLNDDGTVKDVATRGDPGHAQSWGQIPKTAPEGQVSRDFLTSIGSNPGIACNPTKAPAEPG
jgi:hypothetical protein